MSDSTRGYDSERRCLCNEAPMVFAFHCIFLGCLQQPLTSTSRAEQASPLLGNLSPLSTSASWPWLPAAASWGLSFLCCCHTYSPQKPALGLHTPPQAAQLLPPSYSQQGLTQWGTDVTKVPHQPTVSRHLPRGNTVDVTKVPRLRNLDQARALPLTNGSLVPVSGSRMFHPALNIHQPVRYHRMALGSPI